ncbi:MAG: MBL fold metallo-hydrolase [Candidatus Hydrogenedentota bacterium]
MEIIFLGTGTAIFTKKRGAPGIIIKNKNETLLFDPGTGTGQRLVLNNIDPREISAIFITHFHIDHTADLIPLFFAFKTPGYKPYKRYLNIYGPVGLRRLISELKKIYGDWIKADEYKRNFVELKKRCKVNTEEFTIETFPVPHTTTSLGFKIRERKTGVVVSYSGDTGFSSGFAKFVNNSDILILECSLPDTMAIRTHLTPKDVCEFLKLADVNKVVLTHFYPPVDIPSYFRKISKITKRDIIQAYDGMKIKM